MRSYLSDYFKTFRYQAEDADFLIRAYDTIMCDDEAAPIWNTAVQQYEQSIDCDYNAMIKIADHVAEICYLHEYVTEFLLFACMTKHAERRYIDKGISYDVYYNTMSDLRYKVEECKLVKGFPGCFVADWFIKFFRLERLAFGRLQFEIIEFGENYEKSDKILTPKTPVINVHIPRSNTPLSEQLCDQAFCAAKEYYKEMVGEPCAFVCYSWFLYPENHHLLSEKSNIYKFMKRFDLIKFGYDRDFENLWRLFDTDEKNFRKLPTDTSMRRAYVEHLKNGGKLGWGYGVFFL